MMAGGGVSASASARRARGAVLFGADTVALRLRLAGRLALARVFGVADARFVLIFEAALGMGSILALG
jgi:hypothetical protein